MLHSSSQRSKAPEGRGLPCACPEPFPAMLLSPTRSLKRLLHVGLVMTVPLSLGLGVAGLVSTGGTITHAQPFLILLTAVL